MLSLKLEKASWNARCERYLCCPHRAVMNETDDASDERNKRARSQKCSRGLFSLLSLIIHRVAARACVHNLSGAIPESSNYFDTRRRSVCFPHFITCGWMRKTDRDLRRALWITKHRRSLLRQAQAGRRNKAQKKWTGAWRSLRPRRQRAPALCAANLSAITRIRSAQATGFLMGRCTLQGLAKKDYPCVIITYT